MGKFIDLTGQKFGRLIATHIVGSNNGAIWECRCECGNTSIVNARDLVGLHTKSCGCLKSEISSKTILKAKDKSFESNSLGYYNGTQISLINKEINRSDSTTMCRGVSFDKRRSKYYTYINIQGKRTFLGYYDALEDAIKARKQAEEELFKPVIEEYENLGKE